MKRSDKDSSAGKYLPSIVIMVFVVSYLLAGYLTLDETTRTVPLIAGTVTLLLILIDLLLLRSDEKQPVKNEVDDSARPTAPPARELAAVLYLAGAVAGIILVGFLIAIPLYLFASMAYLGKQSLRRAFMVTLISSLTIYIVFEVMLSYQLYKGLLFS